MPRTPSIRYYESRKAYYTKYQGRQHLLAAGPKDEPDGPVYKRAVEEFCRLMHADELQRSEDRVRLSAVIIWYYHHLERQGRRSSLELTKTVLDPAVTRIGKIMVRDLKPFAVNDWIDSMRTWNSSTKHAAISQLNSALYWAVEQGHLATNPIAGMKGKPEKLTRGKEAVIPEPLQDLLIQEASQPFVLYLRLLRGTGARPGEIANTDCRHYRRTWGAIVLPWNPPKGEYRWKCGKKTKRDRIIYLTPELQAEVEQQIYNMGGNGPITVTRRRHRWDRKLVWFQLKKAAKSKRVLEWCSENNFNVDSVMPYGFRHSYITKMLLAGCPIKLLADICGTSVTMIEKNYSHAHDDPLAMRRLFLQFTQVAASSVLSEPSPAGSTI